MINNNHAAPLRLLVHSGGWANNMGNAFIHMGAVALLREACPGAEIHLASALPRWFGTERYSPGHAIPDPDDSLDTIACGNYDVFVSAGMVLCEEYGRILGPSLAKASARGKKVLFLGAGAANYDDREREQFLRHLNGIAVIGFRSRDPLSYGLFRDHFPEATSGIDAAWFLPEAYRPMTLDLEAYNIAAFHKTPEPLEIAADRTAIRTYHYVLDPVPGEYLTRGRYFVSDRPEDYLNLYAGVRETHSDLVHATVATLVYGQRAKFYGDTSRASLFTAVGADSVFSELTAIDQNRLRREKQAQVEWARSVLAPQAQGKRL